MRALRLCLALILAVTLIGGCQWRPRASTWPSKTDPSTSASARNTSADLRAAKAAVVARYPAIAGDALRADPASHADLDLIGWWRRHKTAPYKSVRVWAPSGSERESTPTAANASIWDVVQESRGGTWQVMFVSSASD